MGGYLQKPGGGGVVPCRPAVTGFGRYGYDISMFLAKAFPGCSPEYLLVSKDFLDISSSQARARGGVLSALRQGLRRRRQRVGWCGSGRGLAGEPAAVKRQRSEAALSSVAVGSGAPVPDSDARRVVCTVPAALSPALLTDGSQSNPAWSGAPAGPPRLLWRCCLQWRRLPVRELRPCHAHDPVVALLEAF